MMSRLRRDLPKGGKMISARVTQEDVNVSEPAETTGRKRSPERPTGERKSPKKSGKKVAEKSPTETPEKQAAKKGSSVKKEKAETPPSPPPPPVHQQDAGVDDLAADIEARSTVTESPRTGGLGGLFGGGPTTPLAQRKLQKSSEWDSVLLLVGGTSLLVLLILGGFLYMSLTRGAAEDLFAAAEEAYAEESYGVAMKRYDKYLDAYSDHENASLARVKRVTAHLRQVFQEPQRGLEVAQSELPSIVDEEAFAEIRPELASMLPQVARGFVDKALLAEQPAVQQRLLEKTAAAMKLVNNLQYIPTRLRRSQQTAIEGIAEDVARVRREIERERSLVAAVDSIIRAVEAGDTEQAYEVRQELLSQYPGLDTNESLQEAVLLISDKQREKVRLVEERLQSVTDAPPAAPGQPVLLAHQRGEAIGGLNDQVVYVLVDGSVFALEASTGAVRWRHFVGVETTTDPIPLENTTAAADAIVVDRRRREVQRLDAESGEVLWRLEIDERFVDPVLLGQQLYVATESGRVLLVDADSGASQRQVRVPQGLEVAPCVTPRKPHFYQPAEQDNLYVISNDGLECREVFYIGHGRGTISVPPVLAMGHLFVVENAGPDFSYLHVIQCDENGLNLRTAQNKIRLQGQVLVPPIVGRRRVLVATDRRAIELFDVMLERDEGNAVVSAARRNATSEDPIMSYSLLHGGYLWIANTRLTKYQVQTVTGKLPSEWVLDEQDVYVGPLQRIRDTIVHVRRRRGTEGFTVAATRLNEKQPSWQTELAVSLRHVEVKEDDIEAITARGRLFRIAPEDLQSGAVREAAESAVEDERLTVSLATARRVEPGQWVLSADEGYSQVYFYRPVGENAGLDTLTLTVPRGDAATVPTPFSQGLLVPLRDGRIVLSDCTTGGERVHPFHPEIDAGSETRWSSAEVLPGGNEFVISKDRRQIFRVGIGDEPEPHLEALGSAAVSEPLWSSLAATSEVCYAAIRAGGGDALVGWSLPGLQELARWPLEGRVQWGPTAVGDVVLLNTDEQLLCMSGSGELAWRVAFDHGRVIGQPVLSGGQFIFATATGKVVTLRQQTGKLVGAIDVGEPLNHGPIPYQDKLLVAGRSGVLFVLDKPGQ